jgi:dipeptidyl-peptidase-4
MTKHATKRYGQLAALLATCICALAQAQPLTIPSIFATPDLSGPNLRATQLSPDGRWLTYLQGRDTNKDQLDLWGFELKTGRRQRLIDSSALTPPGAGLSEEEAARRERQRTASLSGILEYSFAPDSRQVLVPLAGDLYLYDLTAPAGRALRRLTETPDYETDAQFSPRGRYVSFIRAQNLLAIDLRTGHEFAITRDCRGEVACGVAEFIAQEEMARNTGYWWAPDEKHIAYTRVDVTPVDVIERFEILADRVKVVSQRYPAAGRPNAQVQLLVAAVGSASRPVEMSIGAASDQYLARVNWFPDSRALAVQRQNREQTRLDLLQVDVASGAASILLTETSASWVDLHDELTFVSKPAGFIWASDRTGYRHLYLHDLKGRLLRPITAGDWLVGGDGSERALRGVDEARNRVYFMANKDSPLERHLYSAPLRGSSVPAAIETGIRRITAAPGWHNARLAADQRQFIDSWSSATTPPQTALVRIDGRVIADIVANKLDATHPYAPHLGSHIAAETGTLAASDGQTLYWQLLKPANMRPGERYPVIVDLYGGPTNQRVRNAWMGGSRSNEGLFRQFLAQQGFVVFTLDNRGSGARGVRFETALHRRMGQVEVEDQVAGVAFLRRQPFVDPQRVGVFGWSYGGYMALRCLMLAPDFFQAGVAGAPVTDWSMYDTHYTERFMGTPANNAGGYAASSNLALSPYLRGRLLLMHGMADDNVLFTHTTALMKMLQDRSQPFELMTYPGAKHGLLRGAETGPHAYQAIFDFFERSLAARSAGTR